MGGTDPKYTGPHQSMKCTADSKIDDWYAHDETENKDVKADGCTTWDAKYKHKSGFVRYKLLASCPKDGETSKLELKDESQARFEWQGMTTNIAWSRGVFSKEIDFGTYHSNNFFLNPYYRWESNKSFQKNSLALGWILRYGDWMFRQHVVANEINEGETTKVGDITYFQKGKFVKDEFTFEWFNKANITNKSHERWKALLSWANKDYGVRLGLMGFQLEMPEPSLFLRYRACDKMSLGAHYTYDTSDKHKEEPHHWHAGMKYVGDKDTTFRMTTNNHLMTKMMVTHRLTDSSTMNFTFGHNLRSWVDGSKAYSKGFLGYPWNYGLVFKIDG